MKKPAAPSQRLCSRHLAARKHNRRLFSGLLAAVSLLSAPAVWAANDAWSTAPTSGNFSGANWTLGATAPGAANGTVPLTGDSIFFGTSSITTLNIDQTGYSFVGITFNTGANSFVIGDGTATANAGNAFALTAGITNNSATTQTINAPINLSAANHAFTDAANSVTVLSGTIGGAGSQITASGAGSLVLASGSSTYSGISGAAGGTGTGATTAVVSVTLNGGTLTVGANSTSANGSLTSGPLGTGAVLFGAATIQGTNGAHIIGNQLRTTGAAIIGGTSDLTFTGGVANFITGATAITVNNTGLTTFSGGDVVGRSDATAGGRALTFAGSGRINMDSAITSGANDVAGTTNATNFAYTGTSTLRSTGANTYNGTTTVGSNTNSASTLLINGTHTGGANANTLSQAYTVYGTLGGTGTISLNTGTTNAANKTVTIAAGTTTGGTLSPGDSTLAPAAQTGILTISGPLAFTPTATVATNFSVQLGGNTAGQGFGHYDQVNAGTITLGTNTVLTLSLVNGYAPANSDVLYLATQGGTAAISGAFVGIAQGATINLPGYTAMATYLANWTGSEATSTLTGGNDFALYNFVAVPEPSTWAAVASLLGLYVYGRRRARRAA